MAGRVMLWWPLPLGAAAGSKPCVVDVVALGFEFGATVVGTEPGDRSGFVCCRRDMLERCPMSAARNLATASSVEVGSARR